MAKRVIFAVAGSGKTRTIVQQLDPEKRSLVITYTTANQDNLRVRIIKRFGYVPDTVTIMGYFPFLYRFCYQPFLSYKLPARGINWGQIPDSAKQFGVAQIGYFRDRNKRLYHNRIARLLSAGQSRGALDGIIKRLEKYYDCLYIDEIQDFAGHDFNLLKTITAANIDILFLGDFYQHTYDTSRDGTTNRNLHQNYAQYQLKFQNMGLTVDSTTLDKSYRCSPTTCAFITNTLGITIASHNTNPTTIKLITTQEQADEILGDDAVTKLFYQNQHRYDCSSQNWGRSKGEDHHQDICVVLSKENMKIYQSGNLHQLSQRTKNKLYVALSRARGNIFFLPSKLCAHLFLDA